MYTLDPYAAGRKTSPPYTYLSRTMALYYGREFTQQQALMTPQLLVDLMEIIENTFDRMERDFGVSRNPALRKTRYSVYVSHSGMNPFPPDCGPGVVGYAGQDTMVLIPDAIVEATIRKDISVIAHETGHAMWKAPGWIQESLSEFASIYYMPSYVAPYDTANAYLVQQQHRNCFSPDAEANHRYDIAAFWSHIASKYGGAKTVGVLSQSAPWVDFGSAAGKKDAWQCVADALKVSVADLIVGWVVDLLTLGFWKKDASPEVRAILTPRFAAGKNASYDKVTLCWNRVTCSSLDAIGRGRIEKGGFEVVKYADGIAASVAKAVGGAFRYELVSLTSDAARRADPIDAAAKLVAIVRVS